MEPTQRKIRPVPPASGTLSSKNPLNIDGSAFDCETYLSKLLKERNLRELMDTEHIIVTEIKKLDSEMQTLVYENYNKFIAATDTIRKMKQDFVKMEDEMDKLAQNMETITEFSEKISNTLSGKKDDVQKLVRANTTLKSLEYIFELPVRFSEYLERKEYILAVKSKLGSTKDLIVAVNLLLQLGEPASTLLDDFLRFSEEHIQADLSELRDQVKLKSGDLSVKPEKISRPSDVIPNMPVDILAFIDTAASGFLSNISLAVASCNEMFVERPLSGLQPSLAQKQILAYVNRLMTDYFETIEQRFELEASVATIIDDSSLVVRALDRFHRRLQAVNRLVPDTDFGESSIEIILRIARTQINTSLEKLKETFGEKIKEIRHKLAASRTTTLVTSRGLGSSAANADDCSKPLQDLSDQLEKTIQNSLKSALAGLLQFTAYDVSFATKPHFFLPFGRAVREHLCVAFFQHIVALCNEFCDGQGTKASTNATLILILSRVCVVLEGSMITYILNLCEQQYRIGCGAVSSNAADDASEASPFSESETSLTATTSLVLDMRKIAQRLVDHFVEMEGFNLSQLLSKSVETRDWLSSIEPRNVRAAMKRVVEDLTAIDQRVGQLYEEGSRRDRSSDSSRNTAGLRSISSRQTLTSTPNTKTFKPVHSSAVAPGDNPLLKKLWSEKIDYFASVEFTKVSMLTGLVKIALKTLLECVRLKTFGKFGLQQVQVDCHYLELYLWRFVSDENLVHHLLEEVMTSTVSRCVEPVALMEPSVVELICEKG